MTLKIDFYLAQQPSFLHCASLCTQLTSTRFQAGSDITILFNELGAAQQVDQQLWTSDVTSFIPHQIDKKENKINLCRPQKIQSLAQCNMRVDANELVAGIDQLIQIVPNNDADKTAARQLYRHFQQLGHTVTVHKDAKAHG